MALADVGVQPNITIKVEEDQEDAEVKGCYIWLSESTKPNFLDEAGEEKAPKVKRRRCSVANCGNFKYKNNTPSEPRLISFHKFPKDETTRAIWIELCNRPDKFSAKSSFICSVHFKPEDYLKRNVEYPLEKTIHRLRPGAIPSLNLPNIGQNDSLITNKNHKLIQSEQRKLSDKDEEEDDSNFSVLQNSNNKGCSPLQNEVVLMELSEEEEREPYFSLSHISSQNKKYPNHDYDSDSDVVTISSSEDDIDARLSKDEKNDEAKKKRLQALKQKYDNLQYSFEKLKTETTEEIERLNGILKNKEDEFKRELREVLSVFLKPEKVESVVEQTVW